MNHPEPTFTYFEATPLQASILEAVSTCGDCGAVKDAIVCQLAEKSVYGSCHDYQDNSLAKFVKASMPKYERNFKTLVKAKILVCVNRRNSVYKVNVNL